MDEEHEILIEMKKGRCGSKTIDSKNYRNFILIFFIGAVLLTCQYLKADQTVLQCPYCDNYIYMNFQPDQDLKGHHYAGNIWQCDSCGLMQTYDQGKDQYDKRQKCWRCNARKHGQD